MVMLLPPPLLLTASEPLFVPAPALSQGSLQLRLVCASPLFTAALHQWLGPPGGTAPGAGSPEGVDPDVVLLVPQHWEELAGWLPDLQQQHGHCPWLLLADRRLGG